MNPLFKLPIHGAFCAPFCGKKQHDLPIQITLKFSPLNLNIDNKVLKHIWSMTDQGERYCSEVNLFKASKVKNNDKNTEDDKYYLQVNCQGNGVFHITKNNITIDWQTEGTGAEHYFQTLAIALNLELNNVLCIHANALAYKNQSIALVAPSRTGKTTLTAAMSAYGFAMMTDDMMALHQNKENEYIIYPSWPIARLWPDSMNDLLKNNKLAKTDEYYQNVHKQFDKKQVNFNDEQNLKFCHQAKKLSTVYFLNRVTNVKAIADITIEKIPPAQAIILLIQNSILGDAYHALNLEKNRIKKLSELVENISFKQVTYSSGMEHLNTVCQAIEQDIQ
jgi:hypothetical protein